MDQNEDVFYQQLYLILLQNMLPDPKTPF
jgi:hypothetical protein